MIGRGGDNSVPLEDYEKSVSRRHAEIYVSDKGITITDQGSLNSTFVNEVRVNQTNLKDGDLVRCGDVVFQFVQTLNQPDTPVPVERDTDLPIFRRFSPEETQIALQDLLRQDSAEIGSVLKLRHQDVSQRTVDKLQILLEVSKRLSSPEQFDRLLEKILNVLFQIMDIDRAVLLLLDEVTGTLEPKASKSKDGILTNSLFYSKRIVNFVLCNGDAVLVDDARIDERFDNAESILNQAIQASICVPLKSRTKVIGVLYIDSLSLCSLYSEEDLEFLTALANQAAIAIEDANLYKKAQEEAVLLAKLERFFPKAVSKKIKEGEALEIVDTEVTALFSDISSFTEMSSRLEPRQVIEMLNEYFKVMVEDIVFPYEGTLEKYIGDALLAVWGAPYQQPDDTERAVRAAIDMQWAARRLSQRWKEQRNLEIDIHIGINTGKVAAGNIGSDKLIQYATIGDTTNVTSRICNAAQAGEILISQATFDKLGEQCPPVEKLAPVMVKGKDQPLQLYRVLWQKVQPVVFDTLNSGQNR
jgi:adenylate cyclase